MLLHGEYVRTEPNAKIIFNLKKGKAQTLELEFSDNGKDIPEGLDLKNIKSLGLQLVNLLIDQLEGQLEMSNKKGTTFQIKFPYEN